MSKLRLEGKVAIVTGAAGGIGEAAARLFVENGALVVIVDVQDELGNEVVASIGVDKACYIHCDVRDEKQVEEMVAYALDKYGTLDIVYSNAGILGPMLSVFEMDLDALDNVMAINVCGGAAVIKHAARAMVARKIRGSIICTASASASRGGLGPVVYTASKHAILGVVRSASRELGMYGIRVNCVSPFAIATPLTCSVPGLKWLRLDPGLVEAHMSARVNLKEIVMKAKDIAEAALFLASDESSCITGQNIVVDGGLLDSENLFPLNYSKTIIPTLKWSVGKVKLACSSILRACVPNYIYIRLMKMLEHKRDL